MPLLYFPYTGAVIRWLTCGTFHVLYTSLYVNVVYDPPDSNTCTPIIVQLEGTVSSGEKRLKQMAAELEHLKVPNDSIS